MGGALRSSSSVGASRRDTGPPCSSQAGEPRMGEKQNESDRIFEQIQMVATGHDSRAVLQALLDSVSLAVAFMVDDLSQADQMIDCVFLDMKRDVRRKWPSARAHRE